MLIKADFIFKYLLKNFDALTIWPFIFIRSTKVMDKGLIEHEMVHYKEQRRVLVLPWLLCYLFSTQFRLAAEIRAYRKQIETGGITIGRAAYMLTKYNCKDMKYVDVVKKLRKKQSQ